MAQDGFKTNLVVTKNTPAADEYGLVVRPIGGGSASDVTIIDPIGQKVMAESVAVVIASDQSPIDVNASVSIPGVSTEAKQDDQIAQLSTIIAGLVAVLAQLDVALSTRASQATLASVLAQLDVALSTRASQATVASILAQLDVALSTRASEATLLDILTTAAFQARINTLGQKTSANSTPVVLASDQASIPTAPTGVTDLVVSGTISALGNTITLSPLNGIGSGAIDFTGTWLGTAQFEATVDGSTWTAVSIITNSLAIGTLITGTGAPQNLRVMAGLAGFSGIRVRCDTFTSGSTTVTIRASSGTQLVHGRILSFISNGTSTANLQNTIPGITDIGLVVRDPVLEHAGVSSSGTALDVNSRAIMVGGVDPTLVGGYPLPLSATGYSVRVSLWDEVYGGVANILDSVPAADARGYVVREPVVEASQFSVPGGSSINATDLGLTVGGKSNDGTPVKYALPLGPSGRSVVTESKFPLTAASPVAVSVGVASTQILAANAGRKGVRLVNTSSARVSLGFGVAAVLDSGMTLYPGGAFNMDEYDFNTAVINGIASAAASNVGAQELT